MIRARLSHLWQHHRAALVAFGLVLCAVALFAVRTLSATLYWMDPAHHDQPIEAWMTPRYVAMSYQLPPEALGPALFLQADAPQQRRSLADIAAAQGLTLADLQARIDAAAAVWRSAHPQSGS